MESAMYHRKRNTAAVVGLLGVLLLEAVRGWAWEVHPEFDLGPFFMRWDDAVGTRRTRAAGPFLERARCRDGAWLKAVRPFWAAAGDPAAERSVHDYLWPVGSSKRFRKEASWRFIVAYGLRFDVDDPRSRYHVWILPIYFQGRDAEGGRYAAVFPLGGSIHEFLGRDRIFFILFPLYMRSSVNDVVTHDFLWPIISHTRGPRVLRYRVFPIYGYSRLDGSYEKRFVLWPIWTQVRYYYPNSSGSGYILFPLWGHLKLTDQESWMFLPPLIRFHRGQRMNLVYAPWPFFQKVSGEIEKLYIWPLWGRKRMHDVSSSFFLWPLFWWERHDLGRETKRRFVAMPLWYSEVRAARTYRGGERGKVTGRYWKLWPLATYQRENDVRRLRLLALWPLKASAPVERSWAPLWTLFEYRAAGRKAESEFLWGLYRHAREGNVRNRVSVFPLFSWERDEEALPGGRRGWSLLKGLLGYERDGDRRKIRFLYFFRIGAGKASR